jgi:hypothetical protein
MRKSILIAGLFQRTVLLRTFALEISGASSSQGCVYGVQS